MGPKHKENKTLIEKVDKKNLFCGKPLLRERYRYAVKDHCHITGEFRGAAHDACNKKLRKNPKTIPIPVVFHNLKGYDAHHLMQGLAKIEGTAKISCIAKNMEKCISFSLDNLRFIDSN